MAKTNLDRSKLKEFLRGKRDQLSVVKELLNTSSHYEGQETEAYRHVESLLSEFASMFHTLESKGELPDELSEPQEATNDEE